MERWREGEREQRLYLALSAQRPRFYLLLLHCRLLCVGEAQQRDEKKGKRKKKRVMCVSGGRSELPTQQMISPIPAHRERVTDTSACSIISIEHHPPTHTHAHTHRQSGGAQITQKGTTIDGCITAINTDDTPERERDRSGRQALGSFQNIIVIISFFNVAAFTTLSLFTFYCTY